MRIDQYLKFQLRNLQDWLIGEKLAEILLLIAVKWAEVLLLIVEKYFTNN